MTPEMVFECLVVSDDIHVVSLMNCGLDRLSIEVEHCASPVEGLELLAKRDVDLIVCDYRGAPGETQLVNGVLTSDRKRQPTVITIVDDPLLALGAKSAGAHVVIRKPLTPESSAQGLTTAYSRMVREERREARRAIMSRVLARNEHGELIPITITDISEHGIGLFSKRFWSSVMLSAKYACRCFSYRSSLCQPVPPDSVLKPRVKDSPSPDFCRY